MPVESPPAAPPAPPPPPAVPPPPPASKPSAQSDPFLARVLADMGKAVNDGQLTDIPPKAPEPSAVLDGGFTSMGEYARFKKEREESAAAKAAEKPPEGTPPPAEDKKEEPKPGEKAAEVNPPPAEPTASAKKPKVVVEKAKPIEEIVEGVVRRIQREQPTSPPEPDKTKESAPPAADPSIEGLDDEQKEIFAIAQFAAKQEPSKYSKLPQETLEYFKSAEAFIDGKRKEDPDWKGEGDEEFDQWIQEHRPWSNTERKKLERDMIKAEVREDLAREFSPKIEETQRAAKNQEMAPEIDKAVESYSGAVAQRFVPDEKSAFAPVIKAAQEKGFTEEAWAEAKAADPLAATIARSWVNQAKAMGKDYLQLVSGVEKQIEFDPKQPLNSGHNQKVIRQQQLFGYIDSQEKIFAEQGGDMRTVNGKTFVPRRALQAMPAAEQAKHWTLGHEDVLDMIAVTAADQANRALQSELKRREEEGYVKNGKHAAAKKEDPPPPAPTKREESPRATVTPAPGVAALPGAAPANTAFTEDELKRQWSGGARTWPG